jgi:hypothetical protein
MRVAIVYVPSRESEQLSVLAKAMAKTLDGAGHAVELAEARPGEGPRLTGFDYVIIGSESSSLGGKLPARVKEFLAQAGSLSGKRSMAFVRKSAFGSQRALARLMSAMEAEGMTVNCAELVSGAQEAAEAAISAPIERSSPTGRA